jgi:hypothetical protein
MIKIDSTYGFVCICDGCGKCEVLDSQQHIKPQIIHLGWTIEEDPTNYVCSMLDVESICYCPMCSIIKDIIE